MTATITSSSSTQHQRRIVAVSNRVPPPPTADGRWPAGGLVSALLPALESTGGVWFGWSGLAGDPKAAPRRVHAGSIDYVTIDLSKHQIAEYYEGFCNRALWPTMHSLYDQAVITPEQFWSYRAVNHRFAEALLPLLRPDDVVWVHDYQLMLVGRELRRLGWRGALGYFHHIPVPTRAWWRRIPYADEIALALHAYDLVGVQTMGDADRLEHILGQDAPCRVDAYPVSIDPERFRAMAAEHPARPFPLAPDDRRQVFFGVDRLDYTKGIRQRLEAFERLLRTDPRAREQAVFVQWAAPSRAGVPEYQDERAAVEEIARRVNARFGDPAPVHLVIASHEPEMVGAGLREADICVVTSLRDGMNLVAKEFAAVHSAERPGLLILSDTCGASEELTEAIAVHGADVRSIESAMRRALRMPVEERRRRAEALRETVDAATAEEWFRRFTGDLAATSGAARPLGAGAR